MTGLGPSAWTIMEVALWVCLSFLCLQGSLPQLTHGADCTGTSQENNCVSGQTTGGKVRDRDCRLFCFGGELLWSGRWSWKVLVPEGEIRGEFFLLYGFYYVFHYFHDETRWNGFLRAIRDTSPDTAVTTLAQKPKEASNCYGRFLFPWSVCMYSGRGCDILSGTLAWS